MASRILAIRDALLGALNAVTALADHGGAQNGAADVSTLERPFAIVRQRGETKSDGAVHDAYECDVDFEILCVADSLPNGEVDVDAYTLLVSGIERALMLQRESSPPLGIPGCQDITLRGHEITPQVGDIVFDGAVLFVAVRYRHDLTDPGAWQGVTL